MFPSERLEQLLSSSFIQNPKFICNCFPTTPWDSTACQISAQAGGEACWGLAEDDRGIEEVLDGCTFGEDGKHVNLTLWICSSGELCGKVMILLSLHPDTDVTLGILLCNPSVCLLTWKFSSELSSPQVCGIMFRAMWARWVCCQSCRRESYNPQSQEKEKIVLDVNP